MLADKCPSGQISAPCSLEQGHWVCAGGSEVVDRDSLAHLRTQTGFWNPAPSEGLDPSLVWSWPGWAKVGWCRRNFSCLWYTRASLPCVFGDRYYRDREDPNVLWGSVVNIWPSPLWGVSASGTPFELQFLFQEENFLLFSPLKDYKPDSYFWHCVNSLSSEIRSSLPAVYTLPASVSDWQRTGLSTAFQNVLSALMFLWDWCPCSLLLYHLHDLPHLHLPVQRQYDQSLHHCFYPRYLSHLSPSWDSAVPPDLPASASCWLHTAVTPHILFISQCVSVVLQHCPEPCHILQQLKIHTAYTLQPVWQYKCRESQLRS